MAVDLNGRKVIVKGAGTFSPPGEKGRAKRGEGRARRMLVRLLKWLLGFSLLLAIPAAARQNAALAAPPHAAIETAFLVRETSSTAGTVTQELGGAVSGFQGFVAGVGDGAVVPYLIKHRTAAEWEWGIGTVTDASPDTLARTTVLRSSNGDAAVDFSAGDKDVSVTDHPAAIPHVAAGAPGVTDDNDGSNGTFLPGSCWIDSSTDQVWICVDDSDGAAVWVNVGGVESLLGSVSELTISSGAVTATGTRHSIDTEGDASSDFLDTINGGVDGQLLLLTAENTGRNVYLTDNGNIEFSGDAYHLRIADSSPVLLIYNGTVSKWQVPRLAMATARILHVENDDNIADVEQTIASGSVTVTRSYHSIDTESDAAYDELATINGGIEGMVLFVKAENSSRRVVVKGDGSGNVVTPDGADVVLSTNGFTQFFRGSSNWLLVSDPLRGPPRENLLLNGDFSQWYRQTTAATAMTDDDYFAPKWLSLIQAGSPTTEQSTAGNLTTTSAKLVSVGTSYRFGVAQIVEASQSVPMRGRDAILQATVRPTMNAGSGDLDVRIALLEWTGTADSVTSEIVNDWTSGTFTTGNFFASTTLTLISTAQFVVAHDTWTTISVSGTVSSSCNNLIAFIWTEDTPDHAADFLEVTECGLYAGRYTEVQWSPRHDERALCERFCYRIEPSASFGPQIDCYRNGTNKLDARHVVFPTMRTIPAFSHPITSWDNAGSNSSTELSAFNFVTGAQVTISGTLTFSGALPSKNDIVLQATSTTSFNGTAGDQCRFLIGNTDTYLILDAEL